MRPKRKVKELKSASSTGTTAYWPPERFDKESVANAGTDMWSVGGILYIMLTGVHPFDVEGVSTDEEILVRKNNWKKEWFKFLELAKTVKLLAILGTHAKDIKIYALSAVQCVRIIQK